MGCLPPIPYPDEAHLLPPDLLSGKTHHSIDRGPLEDEASTVEPKSAKECTEIPQFYDSEEARHYLKLFTRLKLGKQNAGNFYRVMLPALTPQRPLIPTSPSHLKTHCQLLLGLPAAHLRPLPALAHSLLPVVLTPGNPLFLKLTLTCPSCQHRTRITHSTHMFDCNYLNCGCHTEGVELRVEMVQPRGVTLWVEQDWGKVGVGQRVVVDKRTRIRVVGGGAWGKGRDLQQ